MNNRKICVLLSFIFAISLSLQGQEINVKGIVTDTNREPIIGATIVVSGTSVGTSTNINGEYILNSVPHDAILIISYMGMESETIKLNGRNVLDVILREDAELLDELVVIGYGTVEKQDLTGAVAQIKPRELTLAPVASFDEALAGRSAGVQVISQDGQPGGESNIVIRGASSLTQSNAPLYVIDGVAIEDPDNAAINPEEISSMSILKDASATAIYGSRAANGVIIIETKKGVTARPIISFNSSVGFQEPIKFIEMMGAYDFVKYQYEVNESATNRIYLSGGLPETHQHYNPDGRTWDDYRDLKTINWQDEILNTEPTQNYNISIRGRSQGTSYSISGSIFDQKGIVKSTGFNRYQGRINLTQEVGSKARVGLSTNYTRSERHGQRVNDGGGNHFSTFLLYRAWAYRPVTGDPNIDLLDIIDDPEHENISDIRINPLMSSENVYDRFPSSNFTANGNIDYKINRNLNLRVLGSYFSREDIRNRFFNSQTTQASPLNRSNTKGIHGSHENRSTNRMSNENTLTYNRTFQKDHNLNVVGGTSLSTTKWSRFGYSSQHIPNELLGIYGFDEGMAHEPVAEGGENSLLSFFGRIDYNYKSTYLLTASLRGDGSSKFAKNNRWGYFPSIALAWNANNDLLKNVDELSILKLRLSTGLTGNNRVGDYDYLMQISLPIQSSYSFNNQTPMQGLFPSNIANESLKWETTRQTNIGLDLGLYNDRILLNVDLYEKVTKDLLLNADLPTTTGQNRVMRNIGSMSNKGLEVSLQTINVHKRDFSWTSNFNISFNENKILSLTRNQNKLLTELVVVNYNTPLYISRVGYPAGMFFGYVFDGIYQVEDFDNPAEDTYILKQEIAGNGTDRSTIQPGHIKYRDLNNDGTIDTNDMTIIGRGQPIHYGGFTNNFYYKGFSLNVFFQWSYGNQIYNANRMAFEGAIGIYGLNQYASYNDRWTPENRSNLLYTVDGYGPAGYQSNRVLEDGSYLRLKTLSLSYSLPKKITDYLSVRDLAFTIASQNLFTWTNYSGMDPEVSGRDPILSPGYDYSTYPQARTFTFGVNLTF